MPSYSTVLFDLDGTLIDSADCIVECLRHAFGVHGLEQPTREAVLSRMGVPLERSIGMLCPSAEGIRDEVIATYRARYKAVSPDLIRVFNGVPEMLEDARSRGTRVAVVTSKKTGPAEENCRQLGLAGWIECIIGSDGAGKFKPDPEPAWAALRRLGVQPGPGVVVVGDASFDILMGKSAGTATCAVTWGAQGEEELRACRPTHLARTVAELAFLLREGAEAQMPIAQ